jgi:anthranilate synthase component I
VAIFGRNNPKVISLDLSGTQFEIYNKFSRNYSHSFLFESLTGPEELSETSIMGFDPSIIVKGYSDKVILNYKDGKQKIINTNDPLITIKGLLENISDQSYRYLGGAVGIINYDAVALWEKVPQTHTIEQPLMEFGIYEDGILYDNKQKKSFYFFYDET